MADRRVTYTVKGDRWEVVCLCNASEEWSPRGVREIIGDIESGRHTYYVDRAGHRTRVHVVDRGNKKRLMADPDPRSDNNLKNLLAFLPRRSRVRRTAIPDTTAGPAAATG